MVALGPPGSGKTIYLASLHHALAGSVFPDSVTATVVEPEESAYLRKLYRRFTDPTAPEWPKHNEIDQKMREVTFRFVVSWTQSLRHRRVRPRAFPVFNVSYVDYAGDWIPDADMQASEVFAPFKQRIADAHALLGIVDGMSLLQYMEGNPLGQAFIAERLRPVIEFVETVVDSVKPVHFVITKWDLFTDRYTLDDVRRVLMASEDTGFRRLIESRTTQSHVRREPIGTVRLIPVSSLGRRAVLQDDWRVTFRSETKAAPVNIEVPVVAIVRDICVLADERMKQAQLLRGEDEDHTPTGRAARHRSAGRRVVEAGTTILKAGISLHTIGPFITAVGAVGGGLVDPAKKLSWKARRRYKQITARQVRGVTSAESAIYFVAHSMEVKLAAFTEREPASLLDGRP